jgi:hypothetical protein
MWIQGILRHLPHSWFFQCLSNNNHLQGVVSGHTASPTFLTPWLFQIFATNKQAVETEPFFYSILSWTLNSLCLHQQRKTGSKSNRPNQWSEHYRTDPVDLLYIHYSKVTACNVTKTYGEMVVELQSFLASALMYMERSGKLQGAGWTPQPTRSVATAWN